MDFHPYEPFDNNGPQKKVWGWIKKAFKDDEGVAFYQYPVFTEQGNVRREPDFVIVHREFGLWVLECKAYRIANIAAINGQVWSFRNWPHATESPLGQAKDQMYAIKIRLDAREESREKIDCHFRVVLPEVERWEWKESRLPQHLSVGGSVLVHQDLTPMALRSVLEEGCGGPRRLSDEDWDAVNRALRWEIQPVGEVEAPATWGSQESPVRVIHAIEDGWKTLDEYQNSIAFECPDGPQRIRGIAGSGKTVMFALRAAKMHAKHPEWDLAFVFFTQSLYDQVKSLIDRFHRRLTQKPPDWAKLRVMHSWGGRAQEGFYSNLCRECRVPAMTHGDAQVLGGPSEKFEFVCEQLDDGPSSIPQIFDAVIIDEGQDLPDAFYRLAYHSLREPKRLYWAYDEAQGIGSLKIPTPERIFGRDQNGELIVKIGGIYEGGIKKTHVVKRSYRLPRKLLMTAQAINMGLFRIGGPLQGVTQQEEWENLGYKVEGDFSTTSVNAGRTVTLKPTAESLAHPVDANDFPIKDTQNYILNVHQFNNESDEIQWIADQVCADVEAGLKPEQILITGLRANNRGTRDKEYFNLVQNALSQRGVAAFVVGENGSLPKVFRRDGHVTICCSFRAKGNEAWKVYATRFHNVHEPWRCEEEIHKRNEALVALTRSRFWCVVTGLQSPVFEELQKVIDQYPEFTFPAFNKASLKRRMDADPKPEEALEPEDI